ncbi:hypothetical protein [Streptomyces sp. NPDC000878]
MPGEADEDVVESGRILPQALGLPVGSDHGQWAQGRVRDRADSSMREPLIVHRGSERDCGLRAQRRGVQRAFAHLR